MAFCMHPTTYCAMAMVCHACWGTGVVVAFLDAWCAKCWFQLRYQDQKRVTDNVPSTSEMSGSIYANTHETKGESDPIN
eukprot:5823334-Amphidinium_carterae.1